MSDSSELSSDAYMKRNAVATEQCQSAIPFPPGPGKLAMTNTQVSPDPLDRIPGDGYVAASQESAVATFSSHRKLNFNGTVHILQLRQCAVAQYLQYLTREQMDTEETHNCVVCMTGNLVTLHFKNIDDGMQVVRWKVSDSVNRPHNHIHCFINQVCHNNMLRAVTPTKQANTNCRVCKVMVTLLPARKAQSPRSPATLCNAMIQLPDTLSYNVTNEARSASRSSAECPSGYGGLNSSGLVPKTADIGRFSPRLFPPVLIVGDQTHTFLRREARRLSGGPFQNHGRKASLRDNKVHRNSNVIDPDVRISPTVVVVAVVIVVGLVVVDVLVVGFVVVVVVIEVVGAALVLEYVDIVVLDEVVAAVVDKTVVGEAAIVLAVVCVVAVGEAVVREAAVVLAGVGETVVDVVAVGEAVVGKLVAVIGSEIMVVDSAVMVDGPILTPSKTKYKIKKKNETRNKNLKLVNKQDVSELELAGSGKYTFYQVENRTRQFEFSVSAKSDALAVSSLKISTPAILSEDELCEFWVKWDDDGLLSFGTYGDNAAILDVMWDQRLSQTTYIGVRTEPGVSAFWTLPAKREQKVIEEYMSKTYVVNEQKDVGYYWTSGCYTSQDDFKWISTGEPVNISFLLLYLPDKLSEYDCMIFSHKHGWSYANALTQAGKTHKYTF
ncbi:hypothetical protein B566_EDAN004700 [Ephemera danica]|nr:hypothetical protein B566_EDAN004700 [Ephemera danica]